MRNLHTYIYLHSLHFVLRGESYWSELMGVGERRTTEVNNYGESEICKTNWFQGYKKRLFIHVYKRFQESKVEFAIDWILLNWSFLKVSRAACAALALLSLLSRCSRSSLKTTVKSCDAIADWPPEDFYVIFFVTIWSKMNPKGKDLLVVMIVNLFAWHLVISKPLESATKHTLVGPPPPAMFESKGVAYR